MNNIRKNLGLPSNISEKNLLMLSIRQVNKFVKVYIRLIIISNSTN
jgi:hypothetical protein